MRPRSLDGVPPGYTLQPQHKLCALRRNGGSPRCSLLPPPLPAPRPSPSPPSFHPSTSHLPFFHLATSSFMSRPFSSSGKSVLFPRPSPPFLTPPLLGPPSRLISSASIKSHLPLLAKGQRHTSATIPGGNKIISRQINNKKPNRSTPRWPPLRPSFLETATSLRSEGNHLVAASTVKQGTKVGQP